jgi:hypothetical protein
MAVLMETTKEREHGEGRLHMEIGRATEKDYAGILELQSRYYISNLSSSEQKDGFLSAEFTLSQICAMADDLGIAVARYGDRVVGYMCASRVDLVPRPLILDTMLKCLERVVFRGRRVTDTRMFIYGPVCIDKEFRGQDVLKRLFGQLTASLAGIFDTGVAFVAAGNPRSFAAHTRRLGMEKIGTFQHDGNEYLAIAFMLT